MSDEPGLHATPSSPIERTQSGSRQPSPIGCGAIGCGGLLAFVGGYMILFIFAFASMVDPILSGWEWWTEVFVQIGNGSGWPIIVVGASILCYGISLILGGMMNLKKWASADT